jgi:hypothetical protein
MPVYVFECSKCAASYDVILEVGDRDQHTHFCRCGQKCMRVPTTAKIDCNPRHPGAVLDSGEIVRGEWIK